jgi:hypothetical protein
MVLAEAAGQTVAAAGAVRREVQEEDETGGEKSGTWTQEHVLSDRIAGMD